MVPKTEKSNKRNPLIFFTAFILSAFGFEFIFFIMTVHIYKLTESPLNVGIFTTLSFLPRIFSQYYGAMIDKYDRKPFFSFSSLAIAGLLVPMAYAKDINVIYLLWFLISFFAIVILTARSAILTDVVSQDNYVKGNALTLTMLNGAKLLGPFIGGLAAVVFDIRELLYFVSLVYFITFVISLFLRLQKQNVENAKTVNTINEHIVEGLRYMSSEPTLKYLIGVVFSWRLFFGLQSSLFIVYVHSHLKMGDAEYGIFMAVIGIGSILGGFIGYKVAPKIKSFRLMIYCLSIHFLSFALLGLTDNYYISLVIQVISYASLYLSVVGIHTIRDSAVRPEMRGRVMGSITAIVAPPAIISMIAGSYLAELYGVNNILIGAGLLGFFNLHFLSFFFSRKNALSFEVQS